MLMKWKTNLGVLGILCSISYAQTPIISLETNQSTTISPNGQITIEAFIDQVLSPDNVRGYQVQISIVPRAGTVGSLGLVDPVTLGNNTSIFVDNTRSDWVFVNGVGTIVYGGNAPDVQIGAAAFNTSDAPALLTPHYAGTFILLASPTAEGTFDINIRTSQTLPIPTFIQNAIGANVPFTAAGLTVNVIPQASNDNCASSLEIFNGVTPFSTENTTTDGPDHAGSGCDNAGDSSVSNDIWYDYTATCTGQLTVTTCGDANYDTRLAIYDSCACPATNLLECEDDTPGCGTTSELVNNVIAGSCYKIRVGGALGTSGSGNITVACVANDACANANPVTPGSSIQGATINATVDTGLPACGPAITSPGVWYTVTGTGGTLTASLCGGTSYDSRITVYQGSCGSFTCVGNANNTCGIRESFTWCSNPGASYFILVHGNSGAEGTFNLNVSTASCNDNSVCTIDSCNVNACVHTPNYNQSTECCAPSTGVLTTLEDGNPCTNGSCNPINGVVTQTPVPNGPEVECDDNLLCTVDACTSGACTNTDINTLNCTNNAQCPGDTNCNLGIGKCECIPTATMELTADAGGLPVSTCYQNGDIITVRVKMGPAAVPLIGAQFFLEYDAGLLDFLSASPGAAIDPTSPFISPLFGVFDENLGTIDYGVTVGFGGIGTTEATTLAFIRFSVISGCQPYIRFRDRTENEPPHIFTDDNGEPVLPDSLIDLSRISTDVLPPLMSGCPGDTTVLPDPGSYQAVVTWPAITANDACDNTVPVICNPPSGTAFQPGLTTVTCTATNSCGLVDSCSFDITVEGNVLSADVELSSSVNAGPFDRCVTFELFDCTSPSGFSAVVNEDMTFVNGSASTTISIPGGNWDCITAKDPLHTLRSTSPDFSTGDGVNYSASFIGNRATGGHWLVGGNLNNDPFIDIIDFGVFITKFLTPASPDTPCGTPSPDANINGDNVVDLVDFVFVQVNSLKVSELNCCSAGVASAAQPLTEVSVAQLRRMGLYHMRHADLNGDGMLDVDDMIAFINGARPTKEYIPRADVQRKQSRK